MKYRVIATLLILVVLAGLAVLSQGTTDQPEQAAQPAASKSGGINF